MSQIFDITLGRWRPLTTADLAGGGGGNGGTSVTNLTATVSPTSVVVVSDTGTDATIPLADSTNAGVMPPEAVVQLAGLGSASEADVADFAPANHTHALLMTTDERTKLTALPAAADLSTSLAGKMPNTMTGLQTVINGGTPAEKAALQSSVSGAGALGPRGMLTDLKNGRSAVMWEQGDSTGNEDPEWFYRLAQKIAAAYPSVRVEYELWNTSTLTHEYKPVIQAGDLGERWTAGGKCLQQADVSARTSGDVDIRIRFSSDSGAPVAEACLLAQHGASGNRAFRLYFTPGSNLPKFSWTADGATEITVVGNALTAMTAGNPVWLRFTLDVDNGAGGYTWTFYTSTDGNTWTAAGGAVTTSGITSIFSSTFEYDLGHRAGNGTGLLLGKIYKVKFLDGISGPNILPVNIEDWRQFTAASDLSVKLGGSPTLYVVNSSAPGQNIGGYFQPNLQKMVPRSIRGCTYFLSTGHNETGAAGSGLVYTRAADVAAWISAVKAKNPYARGYAIMQNPRNQAIVGMAEHQREFVALFGDVAQAAGLQAIDVYQAFVDDPRGLGVLVNIDGIHPTQGDNSGSALWADTVWAKMRRR